MKVKFMLVATLVSAVLVASALGGCTNSSDKEGSDVTSSGTSSQSSQTSSENKTAESGLLTKVHEDVKAIFGENYIPSMEFDATYVNEQFGISEDMIKEIIAEGPMISTHIDMFVGIEAADGKAEEIETKLNDYRQKLVDDSMQYPMNMPKIKASAVTRVDDYVFFTILGAYADDIEDENELLKHYEAETKKVVDAINSTLGK